MGLSPALQALQALRAHVRNSSLSPRFTSHHNSNNSSSDQADKACGTKAYSDMTIPLSAPISFILLVTQVFIAAAFTSGLIAIALSTASSAIFLYVVHLPPAIVIKSPAVMFTTWSRESFFVSAGSALGSRTRGRSPDHAARTCPHYANNFVSFNNIVQSCTEEHTWELKVPDKNKCGVRKVEMAVDKGGVQCPGRSCFAAPGYLFSIISHKSISLNNIRNILRYLQRRTELDLPLKT